MRYQPLVVAVLAPIVVGLSATSALAHGSMATPISRALTCYRENPERPTSAACKAAVAAGGTQGFYDWMAVRQANANGQSRTLIPDGKLCSAGVEEFKGLDLARADWPPTTLTAGASYTFKFAATAPHKGTFALYITNGSYDPAKPLKWSNLQTTPFLTATDPALSGGSYLMPGKIPAGVTGRQLIYMIWQRSDSPEAFYSCSDVVISGSTASAPAAPATRPSTPAKRASAPAASPTSARKHHHSAPAGAAASPLRARSASDTKPDTKPDTRPLALAAVTTVALTLAAAALFLVFPRRRFFRRD